MVRVTRFLLLFAILVTAFLMLDCGSTGNQTPPPPPPPTTLLAYLHRSGIPNNYIIYDLKILRSDGTTGTVLTSQNLISVVLSPNGQKILYSYFDSGVSDYQIATINPDGSGKTVLTGSGSFGLYPQFTPDGSKIVYEASGANIRQIALMNADGTNPTVLTSGVGENCFPSSNGSIVGFGQYTVTTQGLATMNMDGSIQQLILYTPYPVNSSFSVDGGTIFFSNSDGRNQNIYSAATNGLNRLQLTNTFFNWDPMVTGGKIYFVSIPGNVQNPNTDSEQIFSMNPDGSTLTQVTNDTLYNGFKTANGLCINP